MQIHGNAKLTIKQREAVRRLHHEERRTIAFLSRDFGVSPNTILKWVHRESPFDCKMPSSKRKRIVEEDYRQAIIEYRKQHPNHGNLRIAQELRETYPHARPSTILRVLQQGGLIVARTAEKREKKPLKTGNYRVQMDAQQLPAVEESKGYEYKISVIQLKTRMKYSEIHSERNTAVVAEVLEKALSRLPPFFWCRQIMLSFLQ